MSGFALLASSPKLWRAAMMAGAASNLIPLDKLPLPYLGSWMKTRTLPKWRGGAFRAWMKNRRNP
jgi:L-lactate dehydrogenase complex protein LldF